MKSTLSLTHNCNLRCSYCYAGEKFKKEMSLETAMRAVDFTFDQAESDGTITFGFFGGEPLLRFDLIREIVAYIGDKQAEHDAVVNLHLTTNGTLITREILEYLRAHEIGLCISIDGPRHIHDQARRFRNGKSSFTRVVSNLQKSIGALDRLQVNSVYTPANVNELADTVRFLADLGVFSIHLNPDIEADWEAVDHGLLEDAYDTVADFYIDRYRSGREVSVNLVDSKVIVFLKGGYDAGDRCGMGETEWAFAPSGNIYPCERFIGEDDGNGFCMGNVETGWIEKSRCQVLAGRGNSNTECKTCSLQKYCMNWCGCTNYSLTGRTDLASRFLCASEKASIRAAQRVLSSLGDNALFTDHYYRYLLRQQVPLAVVQ